MANVKITELTAATALAGTDVLPIVDVGADATKKVSVSDLLRNLPDGTASAPALAFADDQNTGVLSPAANELAFATSGTQRLVIDSSGRLLVGASSTRTNFGSGIGTSPSLQIEGTSASTGAFGLIRNANSATASAYLQLAKTRGTSNGSNTIVQNGDRLGYISFSGANGSNLVEAAGIESFVDGTPFSGSDATDMPGRLVFSTTADGSGTPTERLRINSSGNVGIGTTSPNARLHIDGAENATGGITLSAGAQNHQWFLSSDFVNVHNIATSSSAAAHTWQTNSVERVRIDGSGRVGIGTSSPDSELHISKANTSTKLILERTTSATAKWSLAAGANSLLFKDEAVNTERMRIDSAGRLLVGHSSSRTTANALDPRFQMEGVNVSTSTAAIVRNENSANGPILALSKSRGTSTGSSTIVQSGDITGAIHFAGADGTDLNSFTAWIQSEVDGTPGSNDMPGRLTFYTTADGASSPTERMRIASDGNIRLGNFNSNITTSENTNSGFTLSNETFAIARSSVFAKAYFSQIGNVSGEMIRFSRNGADVGSIDVAGSSTSYNTSSDYRLKENVVDLDGAITRVKQLQPKRFNFIVDADTTVDGFLAHEAQTVVPEAVTGTHNEVDDDGNAVMQGIDQSKLVPLLTAALKEAIAKIETLETKVAALEAQ